MRRKRALPTKTQQGRGRPPGSWSRREQGTELVEAAFVVTLLLTFLIGIFKQTTWILPGSRRTPSRSSVTRS
jgi:hypothetical protein